MAAPTHRPAPRPATRRQRAKVPAGAQVHGTGQPVAPGTLSGVPSGVSLPGVAAPPVAAPSIAASPVGSPSAPMHLSAQATPAVVPFQPRALLAPAREPQPDDALPAVEGQAVEPPADTPQDIATRQPETPDAEPAETDAAALMQDLGLEPAPGTPEALALLAEAGVAPKPGPGEPLGPDDERFSPIAIGHLTHRLVDVKRLLEQLNAEQKTLHETLRLAHLRGDLFHLLAPSSEGWCYQLQDGTLLSRRQGRKQWAYSNLWAEMEARLKARQTYEQATGMASWRHGAAFWDLRGQKG